MNRAARRRAKFGDPGADARPVRDERPVREARPAREERQPAPDERRHDRGARPVGTLKFFDTKRGFGFIDHGTGTDLFVHHSGLDVAGHRLSEGAMVEFDIEAGRRGEEARNVRLARV